LNPYPSEDKSESGEQPEKDWEDTSKRTRRKRITNKRKGYIAGGLLVAWIVFVGLYLLFVAGRWTSFFDDVAVIISAFLIDAGIVGMIFSGEGPEKHRLRIRVSIAAAVSLLVFPVLWLPFESAVFNFYHNAAILFAVFMVFLVLVAAIWMTASPVPILRTKGLVPFAVVLIWVVAVICWLWFYAPSLSGNQNVAVAIAALLLLLALTFALGKLTVTVEMEISGYGALALFLAWMILMMAWFWFFADAYGFNSYQNGAVMLLSFLLFVALAFLWEWRKHKKSIPDQGW